jgi:holo-[acyl-carrier protein] synthase
MIFGIGTDIIQIQRMQDALNKNPLRFAEKILAQQEYFIYQERCAMSPEKGLRYLATRFAAKEAFSKAMGIGFRAPMAWHSIQILNDSLGSPQVNLSGSLKEWIDEKNLTVKISLSDEKKFAVAFVILDVMV